MKKPTSEKIKSMIIEIASIVAGVLLALAANEWNENRVNKARANEALINITQEIQSNIKLLKFVNENNKKITDFILRENEPDSSSETPNENFIPALQIQDTAWKTLLSTGVSQYIDYDLLYQISSVYSLQDIYKSLSYQLVQNMMSTDAMALIIGEQDREIDGIDLYGTNMSLLVTLESGILESYDKAMEKLTKKGLLPLKKNTPNNEN